METVKPPLKFVQITVGQYSNSEGVLNHAVYGLSDTGKVYKFEKNRGWIQLKNPVPTATVKLSVRRTPDTIYDDEIPF